jgi:hypothetical protein
LTDRTILWNVRVVAGDGSPPAERMAVTIANGHMTTESGLAFDYCAGPSGLSITQAAGSSGSPSRSPSSRR